MFIKLCILVVSYVSIANIKVDGQVCSCIPLNNVCYQNLNTTPVVPTGGGIDIRIVNNGQAPPVTIPPLIVTPTVGPRLPYCDVPGSVACCTAPGLTGCGVRWNISVTPTTTPLPGQAVYGSQPWTAAILNLDNTTVATGVLLDALTVLTVAHRVFNRTASSLKVKMGEWNLNILETYTTQESLVTNIRVHEQFISTNTNNPTLALLNDVAILRLATPIQLGPSPNPAINTACLPDLTIYDSTRCLVAGWGRDAFNGFNQTTLKEVEVPILTNAECQRLLSATRLGPSFVLNGNNFICAGGDLNRDACVGDGGAGLMCNNGGRYQVVGLVAWGIGCGSASVPGVYVRVQNFLPWINSARVF